jgi:hypothetical protein
MSIKTSVLAVAAALTVAGGLYTAAALPASASTTQCGKACVQIFSKLYGPGFVESAFQGIAAAGQPTILHPASTADPTGDFINPLGHPVLVSDFYAMGMVSAAVNAHYGTEPAVQVEYAPDGQGTGLCAAVATTAYQNEGLSLQPCSTPGTTVFIIDHNDAPADWAGGTGYFPIVNASTTDFTHPYTMTIDGNPAHKPFPQITLQRMHDNPTDVPDNQLWQAPAGPAN